jgi:hypothetical protein
MNKPAGKRWIHVFINGEPYVTDMYETKEDGNIYIYIDMKEESE